MTEAAFPVLGAAFVLLVVLPASALLVKVLLVFLERRIDAGALRALGLRHVLLTAASAVPVAWFFSAALHQIEPGSLVRACLLGHETASLCLEPASFALLLAACVVAATLFSLRGPSLFRESQAPTARALRERIDGLVSSRLALAGLAGRVVVSDEADVDIGTIGLLRPRVVVGVVFAATLTDAMLVAALSHEREHVRAFDPLRYLLLHVALRVNPLGRFLLAPHVARWKDAREAHCDREAVLGGAEPLPLAQALVRAARPSHLATPALGPDSLAILKFRVNLLLAFAERRPERRYRDGQAAIPIAFALFVLALLLPHQVGTQALDALHVGIEQVFTTTWH